MDQPLFVEYVIPWNCRSPRNSEILNSGVNRLIQGDNLEALLRLNDEGFANEIGLIYIDPPFFLGQDIHANVANGRRDERQEPVYTDRWPGGLPEYLAMLEPRLELAVKLLAPHGSLWVHLDWHVVHYVKVMLDKLLGMNAFRNEIVWCYTGPGSPKMRQFNRKHDTLLWYAKGSTWTFNGDAVREEHHVKTQANFRAGLGGSGFGPDTRVLPPGKVPEDWWIFPMAARFPVDGIRRTGYPTEKPIALLERIILANSAPGDWVLDAFAGSGPLAYCADKHGRRWVAIDASPLGIHLARKRLIAGAAYPFCVEHTDLRMPMVSVQHSPASQTWLQNMPDWCDARSLGQTDPHGRLRTERHALRLGRETSVVTGLEADVNAGLFLYDDVEEWLGISFDTAGRAVEEK